MQRLYETLFLSVAVGGLLASYGCTTIPSWAARWPLVEPDKTDFSTPNMRVDAVREFAARSNGLDTPEQREITDQLARQIQVEPDPLVREAIVVTIAEFRTPLAMQVLEAGFNDAEQNVRIACCRGLANRGDLTAVPHLRNALTADKDIDVRIAAAEALGKIRSPEAVGALAVALDDRDPALQFVGVQSLKSISGKDFGGDVRAWRQYAAGEVPEIQQQPVSIADRVRQAVTF